MVTLPVIESVDEQKYQQYDLQLYIKTMQLYSECDIGGDHFVSNYGELHVVFAISRAIGKYMENSGLNKRLSDFGIYNPLVVGKIIEGKHMEKWGLAIA